MNQFLIDALTMPEEWEAIWNELELLEGDRACEYKGEAWQYMGSRREGDRSIHHFRHRQHPSNNGRKEIQIELPI